VIELGRALPAFAGTDRIDARKVQGCASQVWLKVEPRTRTGDGQMVLDITGDSDAHIVRGLIAILLAIYSGRTPDEILAADSGGVFARIGLDDHLTPQRSNGLQSMVARIREYAAAAAAAKVAG
jgi:cysteine desulfuration protein SufE